MVHRIGIIIESVVNGPAPAWVAAPLAALALLVVLRLPEAALQTRSGSPARATRPATTIATQPAVAANNPS